MESFSVIKINASYIDFFYTDCYFSFFEYILVLHEGLKTDSDVVLKVLINSRGRAENVPSNMAVIFKMAPDLQQPVRTNVKCYIIFLL